MPRNPFEWLYEREKQPLKDYVLDEVAGRLAGAALDFPPSVEAWEDDRRRQRFEPLLARAHGRPSDAALRCAVKLYRWELERDLAAIDRYLGGSAPEELALDERETAIFLWQHWLEETLAFKEYAQEKFRWSELAGLADRLEARLFRVAG